MVGRSLTASLIFSSIPLLNLFATLASSQTTLTTCYVLNGTHSLAAGFRCNNATTGHSSCCGPGAICFSNGVCQQSNGNVQDYLRVGCTDKTWQDPACLDQCTTFAIGSTAGIRFCDGAITETTKYCCYNGTTGLGSFACCNTPSDIFNISLAPTVLAQIPLSQVSSSTSKTSSSATSTKTTTTTTKAASSTSSSTSSGGSSTKGVAIGAGVGVPVGLIALAGLGYPIWRHRRNKKKQQAIELRSGHQNGFSAAGAGAYHDGNSPRIHEAEAVPARRNSKKGSFRNAKYEAAPQVAPQELPSTHQVHKMA